MNEMFSQGGKGSTGILTNKQAVARHFGVKQSEVVYFSVGAPLTGYKVIYDKESQRAYSLPADIGSGVTAVSLSKQAVLVHSEGTVDLGELAATRREFVNLSDSFVTGLVVNTRNEILFHSGIGYTYLGELPVTITPETNPVGNADWKPQTDPNLRKELGRYTPYSFGKVDDVFAGILASGTTISPKANDQIITAGGTVWEVLVDSPSTIAHLKNKHPYNVIDFGADNTGVNDSTDAFTSAGGCIVPAGTYLIESDLSGTYYSDGEVKITGSGTVKIIPRGQSSLQKNLPVDVSKLNGGNIYTKGASSVTANASEFYREPVIQSVQFNSRTYMVYTVLEGTRFDPGQDANQTSRIEIRSSNNNLSFGAPRVISTDGEPQASEPCFAFDKKRGRMWVFYTTARGKVGVGHGSAGFDPNKTFQNWMTYSDNYGDSWSAPVNITEKIKPYNATSAWMPPSSICVTADGDLLVPYTWYYGGPFSAGYIRVTVDADGKINYSRQLIVAGGPEGSWGGGEHQIIQLGDGSLLCMLRDYYESGTDTIGRQQFLRSFDGVNWQRQSSIDSSNCKGGMCLYASMANGDSRDTILVTAPTGNDNSNLYRNNLKLWASTDNGITWQKFDASIYGNPSVSTGYSAITPLGSGGFMVVAEGSQYLSMNIQHLSIGAFTLKSDFARTWGRLPVTQSAAVATLCQYFDIPQHSLFFNSETKTLNINDGGTPRRLTDSRNELDVTTAVSTLDSNTASVFYMSAASTLTSITGDASRVLIVSTQSSQPIVLQEDTGVDITIRIRTNKTISAQAILLTKTKFGWYPTVSA